MELSRDFRELLECFSARNVEYVVVGGYALAHHGAPRFTGDLDIYVRPSPANADRIIAALDDFGFSSVGLARKDFESSGRVVQLGHAPHRVDIMTSIDGVSWKDAWAGRSESRIGNLPVQFIGRKEFIANKKAIGRAKDNADIEALGEK